MHSVAIISLLASAAAAATIPRRDANSISVTPHDKYSSSVGVLGCKINTNRVAYWPSSVSCDNICVKVTANGRSVNLLKIDQSGGAYDISYDAWNYLSTGEGAASDPVQGGGLAATYEDAPMSDCADLLLPAAAGKLPLSASNSMNFVAGCPAGTWVGDNYALYNIQNAVCTWGYDELCTLPPPDQGNQASCPHTLGLTVALKLDTPVKNIDYGTGIESLAQ
ncbi:hypothetical protein F4778DRAFT_128489 [Xylariomycetidae sp. FL2044]|nr:hypothetical protein F4778DRAFT_128489 [Xylariomycetidae sp. FL2044]